CQKRKSSILHGTVPTAKNQKGPRNEISKGRISLNNTKNPPFDEGSGAESYGPSGSPEGESPLGPAQRQTRCKATNKPTPNPDSAASNKAASACNAQLRTLARPYVYLRACRRVRGALACATHNY